MSEIVPFEFEGHPVRMVEIDGEPKFVAADVCTVLEIGNVSDALRRLDADERGVVSIDGPNGRQVEVNVVTESGLYALVLGSRKRQAKPFKRWVTHDVLPSIRRTGSYAVQTRPASQLDVLAAAVAEMQRIEREMHETRAEVRAVAERAEDTLATVTEIAARQDAIEGRHDWFAGLAYSRLKGWPTDLPSVQRLGRRAGAIARRSGIKAVKVQHGLYGEVNQLPAWCWDQAHGELHGEAS